MVEQSTDITKPFVTVCALPHLGVKHVVARIVDARCQERSDMEVERTFGVDVGIGLSEFDEQSVEILESDARAAAAALYVAERG